MNISLRNDIQEGNFSNSVAVGQSQSKDGRSENLIRSMSNGNKLKKQPSVAHGIVSDDGSEEYILQGTDGIMRTVDGMYFQNPPPLLRKRSESRRL
jgi:hypothetical protein